MFEFKGEQRRCYAMPLGGLGTGNLAICGDGSLRQWQLHNKINHVGFLPHSFFAIRWIENHRVVAKLLQTDEFWHEPDFVPTPTSADYFVPPELMRSLGDFDTIEDTVAEGCYPVTKLRYDVGRPDLELTVTAWNPLVPGSSEDSSWPVAIFEFEAKNLGDATIHFSLLSTLQNAVGWDGASLIHGSSHPGYGGNRNGIETSDGRIDVSLDCPRLATDHPNQGEMRHVALGRNLNALPAWSDLAQMWNGWSSLGRFKMPPEPTAPSADGSTRNSAINANVAVEPGKTEKVTFLFAWHFPNRYVDWPQWENLIPAGKSRFYLGNRYCHRGGPSRWIDGFLSQMPSLRDKTFAHVDRFKKGGPIAEALSSTVANLRTNICFWTEDGRFYGFEGGHGASNWEGMYGVGGSCPLNCTHVWNYEQGLSALWPDLFRTMRETDWLINLSPAGQLPHRVTVPVYVRKLWDVPIGGPENPAYDGLFGGIMKTYQHGRTDAEWLKTVWPSMQRAMQWIFEHADDRGDGLIHGEQPNTYDIHLFGPNTFIGSQYLAALRAMEEIAKLVGDDPQPYRSRFEKSSAAYDATCFNGEYFVQRIPDDCNEPYQFGDGCSADQLLGQWWAYHVGLGDLLPRDHLRSACQAVFRRNFKTSFAGFRQDPRVFASDHDSGLLVCTYEEGQRRAVPLLYSDEVWTGMEYAFASLCYVLGLNDEADRVVQAVRGRYDGRERNPFNEVECGDHYVRSLSAWSLPFPTAKP